MKSAQSSLASNPILWSLSNKLEDDNEPDDIRTHRSVGVDPDFYDMVDDNILSILLDACKPLFDLVSGTDDPDSKNSTMKPADLLMSTAKLIIAAGFKMKEQARQDMAEEDLGGGIFDQDVKDMKVFASKCNDPQIYEAHEEEILATQLADFEDTPKKLKKYKTGTKLYSVDISDTGSGVELRGMQEIRAPIEQVSPPRSTRNYSSGSTLPPPLPSSTLPRSCPTGWGSLCSSTSTRMAPKRRR
jgi:hypothetical protein